MKVIIDVMSGDNAPLELVKGAVLAKASLDVDIVIVGDKSVIEKISKDETDTEIAIVKLKGEIDSARASLSDLDIALASAQELYNTAQKNVESEIWLEAYLTLKRNKKPLPLVVKLDKGQCCGCFLKVSGETADNVANSDSPIYCEHCGKILYIDTRPSG